jgi:hypothetical protein
LFGAETWTLGEAENKYLESFHVWVPVMDGEEYLD